MFTAHAYAGNPLAVVLEGDDLTAGQMQLLAQEFGFSETAFPLQPIGERGYRLRIFTPVVELPFAGHPSVGAAWVLHHRRLVPAGRLLQSCAAGELAVEVGPDGAVLAGGAPTCGPELAAAPLLAAVGLRADDLAGPARRAGCGIEFTYLLVRPDAVARIAPDDAALRALDLGSGLSVTAWSGGAAHSRVLVPELGLTEDPATGSAAVGLGVHLAASGLLPDGASSYVVQQGREIGRPSVLSCTVTVEGGRAVATTVGGGVVPVMTGRVRVPR